MDWKQDGSHLHGGSQTDGAVPAAAPVDTKQLLAAVDSLLQNGAPPVDVERLIPVPT